MGKVTKNVLSNSHRTNVLFRRDNNMKNKKIIDNKHFSCTVVYEPNEWNILPSINLFFDDDKYGGYKLLTFGFLCFGIGFVF